MPPPTMPVWNILPHLPSCGTAPTSKATRWLPHLPSVVKFADLDNGSMLGRILWGNTVLRVARRGRRMRNTYIDDSLLISGKWENIDIINSIYRGKKWGIDRLGFLCQAARAWPKILFQSPGHLLLRDTSLLCIQVTELNHTRSAFQEDWFKAQTAKDLTMNPTRASS